MIITAIIIISQQVLRRYVNFLMMTQLHAETCSSNEELHYCVYQECSKWTIFTIL